MEDKKKLVAVAGLRKADPTTLQVLTQDVLRTPLVRIDPGTLVDLLALSELDDGQLPVILTRELAHFQAQMFRELADLPDGPVLASFAQDLSALPAERVPNCLREAVAQLLPERKIDEAVEALEGFLAGVEGTDPDPVELPSAPIANSVGSAPVQKVTARKPAKASSRRSTPAAQVDERRGQWIEGDVMERLNNYHNGLKESVMVAGARHRAPWEDVSEKEVMTVLRRLKREGRLRFSAGRWLINN